MIDLILGITFTTSFLNKTIGGKLGRYHADSTLPEFECISLLHVYYYAGTTLVLFCMVIEVSIVLEDCSRAIFT